jgi:hypothetical protein
VSISLSFPFIAKVFNLHLHRLTNGSALTQSFGVKEQLAAVRLFIKMNRTDQTDGADFRLQTNFPKKVFTEEDYEKPLDVLGLVPSAVLILSKI